MHILSTTDSVQNFYTRSSEALSPFYKCFVISLWWRRDTFTEDYSARDINHHLKNKAAICLEGFLESTKAKFNKTSLGSHKERTRFQKAEAEHSWVISQPWYMCSEGWNRTSFAHYKKKDGASRAWVGASKDTCRNRDLATWTWLWHRSSLEFLSALNSTSTTATAKSLWSLPVGKHLA